MVTCTDLVQNKILAYPYISRTFMKNFRLLFALVFISNVVFAQLDVPPVAGNPRATVTEEVGITSISIKYSRPDVNKREGKIWGDGNLVPNGFTTNSFITNKNTSPWRAGANEITAITFEHDVKVEGQPLKAGTYGLFIAMAPDNATLIFSTQAEAWGSFYYEEKFDVLRVNVKPVALDKSVEYLKYEFIDHKDKSCVIALQWEKLSIPFKVEVDTDNIVLARLREQLVSQKGFNSTNLIQAAQFCVTRGINLDEALVWSNRAITGNQGQRSYVSLRNLASVYEKMNRTAQADSVMNEALSLATAVQYTAYGRILISQKKADKAMEVFTASQKKFGDVFGVNSGLASGYSAKGDFANALKYAGKAVAQAPNENTRKQIEAQIAKLKEGKDIN